MSALAVAAVSYVLAIGNHHDKAKFQAGSQPYTPSRVVSCPLNEYGRPQNCSVTTTGRFANPYAVPQSQLTMKDETK